LIYTDFDFRYDTSILSRGFAMLTRRAMIATSASVPFATASFAADANPLSDVYKAGEAKVDHRLGAFKTLNDTFPFAVPKTLAEWKARAAELKLQLRVALGLVPEPKRMTMNPIVTGRIERPGFTVDRVAFQAFPGHSVTGNLYRPAKATTPSPAVIFAHGHWANGRLHEEAEAAAKKMVERGEEADLTQARFFMQAIPQTLAKLGFVVWQFDMVGYADSQSIGHVSRSGVPHANGFADAAGEHHLHSLLGLQVWNCLRSVVYVASLDGVDAKRIGMTGASGGGTQTFLTAALDERIACAVPAVMVSTGMQGGCVCENCSLLRVETGNVEIAGLIAPRPLALTGANDWTKEIMTKGFPELQQLYKLHGKPDLVAAKAWPEYPHNYNRPARELMYHWMMKHLQGKNEPDFHEPTFEPIPLKQLAVYDETHSRPKTELPASELRKQILSLTPAADKDTIQAALSALITSSYPKNIAVRKGPIEVKADGVVMHKAVLGRVGGSDGVPTIGVFSSKYDGSNVCVWVSPDGKSSIWKDSKLTEPVRKLVDAGYAVVAPDVLGIGEAKAVKPREVSKVYVGFTYGYNRSLVGDRAHDVLTVLSFAKTMLSAKKIGLVGLGDASIPTTIAAAIAGGVVTRLHVETGVFRFADIADPTDPRMLPGAVRFGDIAGIQSLLDGKATRTVRPGTGTDSAVAWVLS
jgi:dienelactone hydrolase